MKKKEVYKNSNFKLTREIAKYELWDENTIKKRAKKLFSIASEIWKIPEIDSKFINIKEIDLEHEIDIFDEIDVTGQKPIELNIYGTRIEVSSWKEFFIGICKNLYYLDEVILRKCTSDRDFEGKESRIISANDKNMRTGKKLFEEFYIETNLNANSILNYSQKIVEKYGDDIEVSYRLKR